MITLLMLEEPKGAFAASYDEDGEAATVDVTSAEI